MMKDNKVIRVWVDKNSIFVKTDKGQTYSRLFDDFPLLRKATPAQRADFQWGKIGIRWDKIDEDLSYNGFFKPRKSACLSAIFYAIETIILITSSPIDKLLELFNIYQVKNVNDTNKTYINRKGETKTAGIAKRLAPLQSNNEIYLENQAEIFYNYTNNINIRSKLAIVSNNPAFSLMYPSNTLTFDDNLNIESIKQIFISKFPALENKELEFKYFNINGDLKNVNADIKLNDLMKETNALFVELKNQS